MIVAVPTFEAAGQVIALLVPSPNCVLVHACRLLPADGLIDSPAGSVIVASCSCEGAMCDGFWSWGTDMSTVIPSGWSRWVVLGVTVTLGLNGIEAQPLAPVGVVKASVPV